MKRTSTKNLIFIILFLLPCYPKLLHAELVTPLTLAIAAGGYVVARGVEWAGTKLFSPPMPSPSTGATQMNVNITATGSGSVHLINPTIIPVPKPAEPDKSTHNFFDQIKNISFKGYGTATVTTVGAGYLYLLYSISRMQNYLSSPQRVSLWFPEYELNKLLLLEPQAMHELLIQEFVSSYQVIDQKSLKDGILAFMHDIETELDYLAAYQNTTNRLDKASGFTHKCGSACGYIIRTIIPGSGTALDYAPSVGLPRLFFVDFALKNSVQERISRLHYYKNIFLQSTIVI
jgi:hypothetical protein